MTPIEERDGPVPIGTHPIGTYSDVFSDEVLRERIRQAIGETRPKGTWRSILGAPLTSVLVAGLLGTWLTHYYDTQRLRTESELIRSRAAAERTQSQREVETARAFATFEDISRLLDKRLWRARRVTWAEQDHVSPAETQQRRMAYRETVNEWNENLNRNLSSVERYFGQKERGYLEGEISDGLRTVNAEIANTQAKPVQIIYRINDLNNNIYAFDLRLLGMVQSGEVGSFKRQP